MTLQKFQKVSKASIIFLALAFFGVVSFSIGKVTAGNNVSEVKGLSDSTASSQRLENPVPSSDFQTPLISSSEIKSCTNTQLGFELSYDSKWFTTHNTEDQKCMFFAPYSFVVPQFIDNNFVPINLEIVPAQDWLSTIQFYENPNDFYNVISSQNIEMNGKLVKKIESKSTGEGTTPRGYFVMHLLVFDGENPIRLSYTQLDEKEDVEEAKATLVEMVKNLNYF
ncbi:MAG: hypothetical protein UU34_C0001G0008 [Candidatus Curtissbacteria bacterium GW2011_GWA1_41_11]|uniref:Uncharacterized protein n=1 Tax=Candidatus Curtissbacteria bacterium GW2011_GWA1_41_11 TaxID=1618409 RepID=A0A0G0UKG4_9BACT|nr:MAG: hypothetical protein UT57_C0033G0006 [Microgenomates group bacterium GW2011_GWC1_39_7]KKR88011.1 MAG: hypothetical protein UU34_C0001G0008 [Candidatus Curtissbacteria bacterium GW2011_GWA1_41_11]